MGKHRDDEGEMSSKRGDGGALGPDEGTPRKKRSEGSHDGGALGPDEGTARGEYADGHDGHVSSEKHAHEEHGGGAHEHSNHMPGTTDQPKH
jgi:hypothetical protein